MDSLKYHDNEVRKVPGPSPESSYLIDHPTSKAHWNWTGPSTGFGGTSFIIVYTIIKWSHRTQSGRANRSTYGSIRQFAALLTRVSAQGRTISIIHAFVVLRSFFSAIFQGCLIYPVGLNVPGDHVRWCFFFISIIYNFILPGFTFLLIIRPIWFYRAVSMIR